MTTRELALRLALSALVVGVCAGGFFTCFEKREVEVWKEASAEARRNRYLALGRLLERMGHPVVAQDDLTQLAKLPPPPATVFLPTNRATLGEKRTQELLDWVERGGHLVVVTYTVWGPQADGDGKAGARDVIVNGRPDLLLDRFGLRQRQRKLDPSQAAAEVAAAQVEKETKGGAGSPSAKPPPTLPEILSGDWRFGRTETALAYLEEDAEPLELEFSADFWWDDTRDAALWSVAGDAGAHLIEVGHGRGRITALTSDEPLLNASIGDADHAEFLVRWLRDGREGRVPVWIFFAEEWPSLLELLRRNAAPALAGAAALLALWLWRSLWRFGPLLPAPDPARRRWLEHLEAAGSFHWRQDRGRVLLDGLRGELERELARKRPAWSRLPERERAQRIAHASGLSTEQVAQALRGDSRAPRPFVAAVRALERVRAAL